MALEIYGGCGSVEEMLRSKSKCVMNKLFTHNSEFCIDCSSFLAFDL